MLEVADVFRRYGSDYLHLFGDRMPPPHRRAFEDIVECRTHALGGHLAMCALCGSLRYSYHSCRNRNCPKCHGNDTEAWLTKRHSELLPASYFHLVFTVPKELHGRIRSHQKKLYNVLIKAAAHSLMKLAADPRYVGGKIALLCVLHTWTRAMVYHPHLHCLVPAGAMSVQDNCWRPSRKAFLVPVRALSEIFRAKFMELARKALPEEVFPESVWETKWVVYCKPTVQGVSKVLGYLGRYIHRIALTNSRILSIDEGVITFRYNDARDRRWKTMTLPAGEFIRRFLQHVLPQGFHKVRYFGLLSPTNRHTLEQIRDHLAAQESKSDAVDIQVDCANNRVASEKRDPLRCAHCLVGSMIVVEWLPRRGRSPP